jgi:hypothetical protein
MGRYLGTYQSDRGDRYPSALLLVTIDKTLTSQSLDQEILPSILLNTVTPSLKGNGCSTPFTKRYARLLLNTGQWVKCTLPFMPGTTEYNQFFITAAASFNQVREIGIVGESVSDIWVNLQNGKRT